jgi:hypothetical protein
LKLTLYSRFGIFKADYRGYVGLPDKTRGYSKATYYFSGDQSQVCHGLSKKSYYSFAQGIDNELG